MSEHRWLRQPYERKEILKKSRDRHSRKWRWCQKTTQDLYTEEDIDIAITECNFNKAIGPDGFDGRILEREKGIRKKLAEEIAKALNENYVKEHIKVARLVPLSKNKGSDVAMVNEIRPIAVKSHIFKIMEMGIQNKVTQTKS